jgi:hypothetical protein
MMLGFAKGIAQNITITLDWLDRIIGSNIFL